MNREPLRIQVDARLHEIHSRNDCQREARRLLPQALLRIGEARIHNRLGPLLTASELELLARIGGPRFARAANARFKRQLEWKLFERLWWASPFPHLEWERPARTDRPILRPLR